MSWLAIAILMGKKVDGFPPLADMLFGYLFHGDADDLTGNHNGTNNGATLVADRYGVADKAYDFASGDNISTADWADPNVLSFFTWIKPTGTPTDDRLISWRKDSANALVVRITAGKIEVIWTEGVPSVFHKTDSAVVTAGDFQSIGFSLNGDDTPVIYHNGVAKASTQTGSAPRSLQSGPFTIGGDASGNYFTGVIDDSLAWGVIKTPAEFLKLHNDSKP